MAYYKTAFEKLPFAQADMDAVLANKIVSVCTYFETKEQHPSALNSPLLGVTPMYFTSGDVAMLFTTVGADLNDVNSVVIESPYTEDEWVIVNDPYNHLVLFLIYKAHASRLIKDDLKYQVALALLKLLHYKFFTSIVRNSYPYGADEATMSYVINSLSKKFDIARVESWGEVIVNRCKYLLSDESIHKAALHEYTDDVGILYTLSDCQSNLRTKIVRINQLYYQAKENNERISTYSQMDTIDGKKIIQDTEEVFDTMIAGLQTQTLSASRFLDMELIEVLSSKYKEISSELLRNTLSALCDLNSAQSQDKQYKHEIMVKDPKVEGKVPIIVSMSDLIRKYIQTVYRLCMLSKDVNMTSKKAILLKVINLLTSSQTNDENVLTIKRSYVYFVTMLGYTRRAATIAALSLCVMLYILIRSFQYV